MKAKVKKISWFTSNKRFIVPRVEFTKSIKKITDEYDAIILPNPFLLVDHAITKNSEIVFDFDENDQLDIIEVKNKNEVKSVKMPLNCPSCGGSIEKDHEKREIKCQNDVCFSFERGPVHALMSVAKIDKGEQHFYLSNFVVNSDTVVEICSYYHFFKLWEQVGKKGTSGRFEVLKKGLKCDEFAKQAEHIESKINCLIEDMQKGKAHLSCFWDTLNLKLSFETKEECLKLFKINPIKLDSKKFKKVIHKNLSKTNAKTLEINEGYIAQMAEFLLMERVKNEREHNRVE